MMVTETTIEEPKEFCPTCRRELLASALDRHLFCPECGFRPDLDNPRKEGDRADA